jgi:hypothetical protein
MGLTAPEGDRRSSTILDHGESTVIRPLLSLCVAKVQLGPISYGESRLSVALVRLASSGYIMRTAISVQFELMHTI